MRKKFYTVKIRDLTTDGAGIGKIVDSDADNDIAMFVDGALPGDLCEVKMIKMAQSKNYAYGELIKIIEPSPDRVKPMCQAFEKCGGCALQSLSYEAQLRLKHKIVADCIERIGGVKDAQIHDTVGMDIPYNYRNKAQFPVKRNRRNPNKIDIGFYSRRTHEVINVTSCVISHESTAQIIKIFKDWLAQNNVNDIIYDEVSHSGLIRHIFVRNGFKTGEIMVCIVVNSHESEINKQLEVLFEPLVRELRKIESLTGVILNINSKQTNVILGKTNKVLYGRDYIYDYLGDKKFKISLASFYQINPTQTEKLYAKALEFAEVSQNDVCIDAYCGIGTIALTVAPFVKKVYGIESVGQAVLDAQENAKINNITNAEFIKGKSEHIIPELIEREAIDLIIVDPPRKGCDIKLIEAIIAAKIRKVVYISCNPATLARDIKILVSGGYKLREVQPIDCFPHTMHVESVAVLELAEL